MLGKIHSIPPEKMLDRAEDSSGIRVVISVSVTMRASRCVDLQIAR